MSEDKDMTTEQELLEVLGSKKQGKKEERETYLQRITKECKSKWWPPEDEEVSTESDEAWERLSDPVQEWVNNAIAAYRSGEEIVEFPDAQEAENEEEESKMSETEIEEETPRKVKKPAKPEKAAKAAKANGKESVKAEKPAKEKVARPKTARRFVRETVISRPAISVEDLMEKLGKAGYSKISETTVSAMRSSVRDVLRILTDKGIIELNLD